MIINHKNYFDDRFVCLLPTDAIGPNVQYLEYLSRFCEVSALDVKKDVVCICPGIEPANSYLVDKLREITTVIESNDLYAKIALGGYRFLLSKNKFIPDNNRGYIANGTIYNPKCQVKFQFSLSEENRGWGLLRELGVNKGDEFICVHNRDSYYWGVEKSFGRSWDAYRDTKFADLGPLIKFCRRNNLIPIRVGHYDRRGSDAWDCLTLSDLPTNDREFLDFFLQKNCLASVCGGSGIAWVPYMFQTFVLYHNLIPLGESPAMERGVYIPKLIFSKELQRNLSFREQLAVSARHIYMEQDRIIMKSVTADAFQDQELYDNCGLVVKDNSPSEVLTGFIELLKIVRGGGDPRAVFDMTAQAALRRIFPRSHPLYRNTDVIISPAFLEAHDYLLR